MEDYNKDERDFVNEMATPRKCRGCGEEKVWWFPANPNYCKECHAEWEKGRKALHSKTYGKVYAKARRAKNPEVYRQKTREWRAANLEKARAIEAKYAKENPARRAAIGQAYRARKRNAKGRYTVEQWEALCAQYGNVCLCCKLTRKLTVDHIIPLSQGGSNGIENIQPLCKSCNSSKGAKTIDFR